VRRSILWGLLAAGCATVPATPPAVPETAARAAPVTPVTPVTPEPSKTSGPGWRALPGSLSGDPTKLPLQPLQLAVVKPQRETWPNGLQIYWMEDHTAPLISVRALVNAGTVDDPADRLGVADLAFDLLASGGAGSLDAAALDSMLEFHAALAGGGAGDELSSLSINLRKEDAATLLPVFADMLLRPRYQEDRMKLAVAQSVEDVRRRADSPGGLAERAVRKAVYGPESLLGREETAATLQKISRKDVQSFHFRHVVPGNTRLLVSGDFDPVVLRPLLQSLFGEWKGATPPARTWPAPPPLQRRVILVPKETPQVKIRIAAHGYTRKSPAEYALRVMNTALGGGLGVGRLYLQIRDAQGLAYSAGSSVAPGPTTGIFVAGVDTRPETATRALTSTLQLLDEARNPGAFNARELALATDTYLNSFAFRFDEPEKVVREKATFDVYGYPEDYLERFRDHISRVDGAAVSAAAQQLLDPATFQIVVVGPPSKLGDLSQFGTVTVVKDVEAFR
jgi:zinc protease